MELTEDADPNALHARARAGEEAAWDALVRRYSGMLWSIARSYRLDDADCADVVQFTWLRLVERLDTIRKPEAVGAWLAVTARRQSLRTACSRGLGLFADVPPQLAGDPAGRPDELVLVREDVGRVAGALRTLPRRCRDLLRLLATAPTYGEVSAALDIPVGSIGPTRARCIDRLRRALERGANR